MKRMSVLCAFAAAFLMITSQLYAATNYDLKKITPEIDQALKNRQARYYQLQGLKKEGSIGENNKGYVTSLGNSSDASSVSEAENRDRRVIYEAIVEQNMLGGSGLLEVQKVFAEVQSEKALTGEMVQSPEGNWKKKTS